MTKLPGCKAVCDPEDFRTIQEKIASMLMLYLNQEVKMLLSEAYTVPSWAIISTQSYFN